MSLVLNDIYNEWYETQLRNYIIENDVEKHPERLREFFFDLNQLKIDTIKITDSILAELNVQARLQTNADIHCIGRQTVYDNINKAY